MPAPKDPQKREEWLRNVEEAKKRRYADPTFKSKGHKLNYWTTEEDSILLANYGKLSYEQIAVLLPERDWVAVRHRANRLNLTHSSNLGRKYCADRHFFAVPNIINSYWAGFIAADGNVSGKRLKVGLAIKDALHVEHMREALGYTGKVHRYEKIAHIEVACLDMVADLKRNFNITERKSLTLQPPSIVGEDLIKAFIVGVIDGDGSITTALKEEKYLHLRIVIYGTQDLLEWIKAHFDMWVPPTSRIGAKVHKRPIGELYGYHVTAGRAIAIGHELLKVDVPRLDRKWDVLKRFL